MVGLEAGNFFIREGAAPTAGRAAAVSRRWCDAPTPTESATADVLHAAVGQDPTATS